MKKPTGPQIAGSILATLGTVLALRWIFGWAWIDRLVPGANFTSIVNPLLFIGVACCIFDAGMVAPRRWLRRLANVAIVALLVVPLAYLFESTTDISLGIDFVRPGLLPVPGNPHPGRLSPNASVAFLLCGLAFRQLRRPWSPARDTLYVGALAVVALIGLAGLLGYLLRLEMLYKFVSVNRLLPVTAFGFFVAGVALWLLHEPYAARDEKALQRVGRRIGRRSLAVLTLVAIGGGVTGFAVLRDTFETSVSQNLLLTASTSATSLANTLEAALRLSELIASRPTVTGSIGALDREPGDDKARAELQRIADALPKAQLSAARFFDSRGRQLLAAGTPARQVRVVHPLQGIADAELLWDEGYLLRRTLPLIEGGRRVGHMDTEQRLTLIDKLLAEVKDSGPSLDVALCSRDGERALCAPTKFRSEAFALPLDSPPGTAPYTMARAIRGERGVELVRDPRGAQVISAFLPIQPYGLALGVKSDVDDLYAPLRDRLQVLLVAIIGIVGVGAVAQRSQVRPVIEQLVTSREQVLRQAATLRSVTEALPAIVAVVGKDLRYRFVNSAFERWVGRPRDAIVGSSIFETLGEADHQQSLPWAQRALAGETVQFERSYPHSETRRHLSLTYIPLWNDGVVDGFIGVGQDITEHREEAVRLLDLAHRDPLTGLLNRSGLQDYLRLTAEQHEPVGMALLYIDLDRFKPVNDEHGHAAGDELLRQFGERLQAIVRPTDAVARLGGDEFAIALPGMRQRAGAEMVADKVLAAASAPFRIDGNEVRVGASVGVALQDDAGGGWESLARQADARLYEAKRSGRGRRA